ncbi:MAG: LacI family DNA-binding transcriptional regulator [Phyllobacterium sp.]
MSTRAKIKDIARQVGVSPATVSRALAGSSLVAEPTLSRVREAAQKLNYRPNVSARNLRTQKSMAVLLVVRDVANPFYLEIFKGVDAAAREAGYSVLMGNTEDHSERELEYFDMLRDGHADGMILMNGKLPSSYARNPEKVAGLPIVVALEVIENAKLPHVQIDNEAAARVAVQHLLSLGHRRIAHICGPIPEVMSVRRREGFRKAMQEAGFGIPERFEPVGDYTIQSGAELCRELYSRPNPPSALFVGNDQMAFGAINELRRMGLSVPGDVSVVGFDDLFLSECFFPPLTTISQPRAEIGRHAMSQLLHVMNGDDVAPLVEMPTALKIRNSTAPVSHNRIAAKI